MALSKSDVSSNLITSPVYRKISKCDGQILITSLCPLHAPLEHESFFICGESAVASSFDTFGSRH